MKLSFAEIDSQHVELLPARTAMSMFILGNCCGGGGGGGGGGDKLASCVVGINELNLGLGLILATGTANGGGGNNCSAF
jgi:hypothetical protein